MIHRFKILFSCLSLFLTLQLETIGQSNISYIGGAYNTSMAGGSTMFSGVESIYFNPAGLTSLENIGFDISYNRRYNLNELATVSLAGAKKIGKNAVGISVSRFGYSAYSESRAGISYARKLFTNVSIGGSFHYLGYNIDKFGSATRFTFDFGVQSEINEKLHLGAYIFNPGSISLNDEQDVPSRIGIGLKYLASKKASIYLDASKTIDRDIDFKFSVDYKLAESFSLRGGANVTQSSIHFGPAYHMKNGLSIVGGYSFDNRLGHSTGLSISYTN